jgi:hypothetical protein
MTSNNLPYHDTKPQGAADFYFAINATFRFIHACLGRDGWVRYLHELASGYFAPVNEVWRRDGLQAVAPYWRDFYAAEPGAEVDVHDDNQTVTVEVRVCPAIAHLKKHQREIVPYYCEHCYHLNNARAEAAGLCMRLAGGNGRCRQTFSHAADPQDMNTIAEATS